MDGWREKNGKKGMEDKRKGMSQAGRKERAEGGEGARGKEAGIEPSQAEGENERGKDGKGE